MSLLGPCCFRTSVPCLLLSQEILLPFSDLIKNSVFVLVFWQAIVNVFIIDNFVSGKIINFTSLKYCRLTLQWALLSYRKIPSFPLACNMNVSKIRSLCENVCGNISSAFSVLCVRYWRFCFFLLLIHVLPKYWNKIKADLSPGD